MASTAGATRRSGAFERMVAMLLVLVGAGYLVPGIYLASLGGSIYYAVAGVALITSGLLVWRGRTSGYGLYVALVLATILWALWESGLNGWALLPRLDVLVLGSIPVAIAWLRRHPRGAGRPLRQGLATAVVLVFGAAGLGSWLMHEPAAVAAASAPPAMATTLVDGEWPSIGRTGASERFSPLGQITPANVAGLEVAWKVRLGMPPQGMAGALQATPLKIGDTLYTCGMANQIIALDAETGATRWRFDPKMAREGVGAAMCRGVTYVPAPATVAAGACGARIVLLTHDARMIAVDAASGQPCPGFGTNGQVDLRVGMGPVRPGYLYYTSPAILVRGKLVLGSSVLDGQMAKEPSGVIRAFDAISGNFAWAWDMGRPGQAGMPGPGEMFTPGTPNAWPPLTADEAGGTVFIPTGNATPDYIAAHRSPLMNRYSSSVVALDAGTGAVRWSFQTVHRDVWDYDVASPPTLTDMPMPGGGVRPAVIVATKRGVFFVLDRETGRPLIKTIEKPVPQNPVPGERLSPTQPYPVGMPSFTGDPLTEKVMWGMTPFDQMWCRIRFRQARYDGDFTPIGLKPTIVYPGYLGGSEWGGVSVDPTRRIMVVNVNHFPMYNQMVPRAAADVKTFRAYNSKGVPLDIKNWPQEGTPYATRTSAFMSPLGSPCLQPPFSEVAAIDLTTRRTLWRKPLGTARDSGPFGLKSMLPIQMGVPAMGGSLVTKSGLMFIAASQDRALRAFDTTTGRILWEVRLPFAGHANPMTYVSAPSGRQFVVVPASGHPSLQNGQGDYLIAYALPKGSAL